MMNKGWLMLLAMENLLALFANKSKMA